MIIVSVLYPNGRNARFDIDYYTRSHMPMVQQRLGAPLRRMAVEHGLAGGTPGSPAPFLASGHLYFDSLEAFQGASRRMRQRSWPTSRTTRTRSP